MLTLGIVHETLLRWVPPPLRCWRRRTLYRIHGLSRTHGAAPAPVEALREIAIPAEKAHGWQVEADFMDSIRLGTPVQRTSFETGVAYMEFTEAVARSARSGVAVKLPLTAEE